MKILCIVPLGNLHPRWVFCLHILTCASPLGQFTFSVIQKTSTALLWRISYCPAFCCGIPIVWDPSSSSGCPIVHVSIFPVVSLKGSKLPLTFFSYCIWICLLQVVEGYKYKSYMYKYISYMYSFIFTQKLALCNIVYCKYLKALSLNKLWKVRAFHSFILKSFRVFICKTF